MEKMLTLGVVLSASDMLSPVFKKAGKNADKFDGKIKALGVSMAKLGTVSLGLGTALAAPPWFSIFKLSRYSSCTR